jgi:hypothetical protein
MKRMQSQVKADKKRKRRQLDTAASNRNANARPILKPIVERKVNQMQDHRSISGFKLERYEEKGGKRAEPDTYLCLRVPENPGLEVLTKWRIPT